MNAQDFDKLDRRLQREADDLLRALGDGPLPRELVASWVAAAQHEASCRRAGNLRRPLLRNFAGIAAVVAVFFAIRGGETIRRPVESISSNEGFREWLAASESASDQFSRLTDERALLLSDDDAGDGRDALESLDRSIESLGSMFGA